MLTADQISQIRMAMEEEHRLDMLALERLSRFLPKEKPVAIPLTGNHPEQSQPQLELVKSVLQQNPTRTWTIRTVLGELQRRGVVVSAKSPTVSISSALKKLSDRGIITLIRKGAGREPSIYQFGRLERIRDEDDTKE